jgi:O-antigen ligase
LIDQYDDIVMQSPVFGWGRANWPLVQGMLSIDNNYLFVALGTGLVGLALFVVLFLLALWRIFRGGYSAPNVRLSERTFRFALFGALVSIAISTGTTYISAHLYPLFFLFVGWAETCATRAAFSAEALHSIPRPSSEFALVRVVA